LESFAQAAPQAAWCNDVGTAARNAAAGDKMPGRIQKVVGR
jgi:hypothetical protein